MHQRLIKIPKIRMKPIKYYSIPESNICLICQDNFNDGNRITMCEKCKIYLHYNCQIKWIYYYNNVLKRNCCHCKQSWMADYTKIAIVKQ